MFLLHELQMSFLTICNKLDGVIRLKTMLLSHDCMGFVGTIFQQMLSQVVITACSKLVDDLNKYNFIINKQSGSQLRLD